MEEDSELRIAAYLSLMQCPNTDVISHVRSVLENEEINQVCIHSEINIFFYSYSFVLKTIMYWPKCLLDEAYFYRYWC